jgi:transposase-like protein
VLLELSVVEQRYGAVMEVLRDGLTVTEVADRHGVSRQSVHSWIGRYEREGLGGLADRSRPVQGPDGALIVVLAASRDFCRTR